MNVSERIAEIVAKEYDPLPAIVKAELDELWELTTGRQLTSAEGERLAELIAKYPGKVA